MTLNDISNLTKNIIYNDLICNILYLYLYS